MPYVSYKGDRTAPYTHKSGSGLLGKVIGPNRAGRWFIVTDATYDETLDRTLATLAELKAPGARLDEITGGDE